jgi:hypothetical protein
MMGLFKKEWTPQQADRWTWHDLFACVFGVLAFVLITVGLAGTLLLQPWGFVALALSILCTWLTFKVIDPKLRALSRGFEDKQAGYLDAIERNNRWEG